MSGLYVFRETCLKDSKSVRSTHIYDFWKYLLRARALNPETRIYPHQNYDDGDGGLCPNHCQQRPASVLVASTWDG